jgi:hypothetical protein
MQTKIKLLILAAAAMTPFGAFAQDAHSHDHGSVSNDVIELQRANLTKNTNAKGYGPQSPRDLATRQGSNSVIFNKTPAHTNLNLCNIHFHENAEHKGGQFTTYVGNGDGKGFQTGFKFSGKLTKAELSPLKEEVCKSEHGGLQSGDTIEVHYVHSSALVTPGPTLGACLNEAIKNPQLRVEAQVYVLVNDPKARDFGELTKLGTKRNFQQALGIPKNTGKPIQYAGSTTGPSYNEQGSPFQVSWSVRPKVAKVNIESVGKWCEGNVFKEDHAHGVRNLVTDPALISNIEK